MSRPISLLILMFAAAGCGSPPAIDAGLSDAGLSDAGLSDAGLPDAGPPPGDPFEPPPELAPWSAEEIATLAADIDAVLDGASVAGTSASILVIDLETGQELYARDPDVPLKPASNTKLFTTAAAFARLGAEHRFPIIASGVGTLDPSTGALSGDLHLIARHELTSSTYFHASPEHPSRQLARALVRAGLESVEGDVVLHGEVLWDGARFGTYAPATERAEYAAQLDAALAAEGVVASPTLVATDFDAPAGAVELARFEAVPLSVVAAPINSISHNEMADSLVRHLGLEETGESTYAAGTGAVVAWLDTILDTTGLALNDGSGLSHDNRVSARQLVGLMAHMLGRPDGEAWLRTFSVSGYRGTLAGRMTGPDTLGRFYGKSGTLNGVITTSGVLHHLHDGRRYVISALLNAVTDAPAARVAENRIVEAVAADRGGPPLPAAPVLTRVLNAGTGSSLALSWEPVTGADEYLVWLAPEGEVFERTSARLVRATDFEAGALAPGRYQVRVCAVTSSVEGPCSDVYPASVAATTSPILLVDGDDRWQAQPSPENTLARGHDFLIAHAEAFGDELVESATNRAIVDGDIDLSAYTVVVWSVGEEALTDTSFDPDEQARIRAYLDGGGGLFVSGAEIGWDLVEMGTPEDASFFREVLRAEYVGDDAGTFAAEGVAGICHDLGEIDFYRPTGIVVSYPEQIAPSAGSTPCLEYIGGLGGTAAVAFDGEHRLFHLGFPFEAIAGLRERRALMSAALPLLAP